jgi:hypothetical protein
MTWAVQGLGMVPASPNLERSRSPAIAAGFALCAIGIALFILDVVSPLGVADGVGYAPLLALSLWLPGRRTTIILAAVYALMVIVGQLAGHGGIGSGALVNRGLALVTIAVMAAVVDRAKRQRARD